LRFSCRAALSSSLAISLASGPGSEEFCAVAKLQMKVENKHVEEIARSSLVDTQVREASVQVAVLHKNSEVLYHS
jgi:hypothetical protein